MNILGQKYEVIQDESLKHTDVDGLCLKYSKQIKIRLTELMLDDCEVKEEKQKRYNEVLRHEAVHAFFSESGLDCYSNNEDLVDWIANQFPKMYRAFKEYDCLE
jgi:hypothetical protein